MPRPAERQPAHVLHRRPFRETSVIVELLTRDFGRVSGVVRGARGGASHLEPFSEIVVTWRGRGQLATVLRWEATTAPRLSGDCLFAGLYVNELLVKTLQQDEPAAALFAHYREAIAGLAASVDVAPILRTFERRLLDELGYGLAFDVDVQSGRPIERGNRYDIVVGEGFRERATNSASASRGGNGQGPPVLTGGEIAAIADGDYRLGRVRRAARQVFGSALELRLGGRQLTTRSLLGARPTAAAT